ncbi:hypothetical protein [Methanimicrococcus hacksteinii]|uniref:hypothetical protein n=1 Tax=Methanimicrococcus hacksteinii TaxID=3028293 RepID=UPI00298F2E8F|nr:hypothetical protein [Methanimicrococcus sp. At1]
MHHLIFITSARYASVGTATLLFPFAQLPYRFRLHSCLTVSVCTDYLQFSVNTVAACRPDSACRRRLRASRTFF